MDPDGEEKTALEWLARDYPESPRKRLKQWFSAGRVCLDGSVLSKPHELLPDPGDRLSLKSEADLSKRFFTRMPTRIHAQLNLLYIDHEVAVVNKGPGLLSVPAPDSSQSSALDILARYLEGKGAVELERNRIDRRQLRPAAVHRIDQFTSGLLCFAMNPRAHEMLVRQIREHRFIREYLALADGALEPPRGVWRSWFKLDESGMHQSVEDHPFEGATEAVSRYEVVSKYCWPTAKGGRHCVSRLRLRLESGLKHQLRIHAARAGCPLLGDRHYHPDYQKAASESRRPPHGCKRQALHASSIGFIHPETGKMKRFSSKFPRDLAELEDRLRAKTAEKS